MHEEEKIKRRFSELSQYEGVPRKEHEKKHEYLTRVSNKVEGERSLVKFNVRTKEVEDQFAIELEMMMKHAASNGDNELLNMLSDARSVNRKSFPKMSGRLEN